MKSLMVHYRVHFLTLAGASILVGATVGLVSDYLYDGYIENNIHFDGKEQNDEKAIQLFNHLDSGHFTNNNLLLSYHHSCPSQMNFY